MNSSDGYHDGEFKIIQGDHVLKKSKEFQKFYMEVEVIQRYHYILFGLGPKMRYFHNRNNSDCYYVCLARNSEHWLDYITKIPGISTKKGDKVSLLLDMETGSIEFLLNGMSKGKHFDQRLKSGHYYLTIAFFQ
jgi:hypothetical protein